MRTTTTKFGLPRDEQAGSSVAASFSSGDNGLEQAGVNLTLKGFVHLLVRFPPLFWLKGLRHPEQQIQNLPCVSRMLKDTER